jgi:hypothetical protein
LKYVSGTEVHVKLQANIQGVVYDKAESKLHIESLICHTNENTGFLIWFGDYCISCIFQKTSIKNMSYSILAYDDDDNSPTCTTHYIKNIKDKHTLVNVIFNLATTKIKDEIVNYEFQFLSCFSELTNCERKRIMKNHRQNYINDFIEPGLKKQKLETKQMRYKTMDPLVKQQVNSKHVNDYKIMAQEKKQKILENSKTKYEMLDKSKKEEQLTKNMNYRKTMNKGQKQKILENKRIKYEEMEQSKKEELLTKKMNYKETMGEEQKQKLLVNKRAKYQAMDISKKKELSAMNSSKIMLNRMSLDPNKKMIC